MLAAERAAWLRLIATPGLGPRTARHLLGHFGLPNQIFDAGLAALTRVVPEPLAGLLASDASADVQSVIEATEHWLQASPQHALVSLADAEYPQLLLNTPDPPPLLFAVGRVELLTRPALAIVGSRNATQQGLANAAAFAAALARSGLTIVSGLALGIDAAAHQGALDAGSDAGTIAVVGTGVDITYPAGNRALAQRIRNEGLVISEFPLRTPALAQNFPRRNRIIAGLARGVLVVEAALRSGSLITARFAADAGRDVFAVPGSIHSPLAKGCHRLIREGAKLVDSAQDIAAELGLGRSETRREENEPASPSELLELIGHDPVDLDTLAQRTGRDAADLAAALLELELAQDIERLPGNRYQRLR
ncbi:MAG TPA: DNA-processing protein DprA [Burkholderiaceae bacterium]|nr:DNA-processing protein DprA [Burkholderiaceae bacterium]